MLLIFNSNVVSAVNTENTYVVETANVIMGSAPYISFDGGRTKISSTEDTLWMSYKMGNKTFRYTPANNPSSPQNPILLPESFKTFADIDSVVPKNQSIPDWAELHEQEIQFNSRDNREYFFDDDGDKIKSGAGELTLIIADNGDHLVDEDWWISEPQFGYKRSDPIDPCRYSYRLILKSSISSVTTELGIPSESSGVPENVWKQDRWSFEKLFIVHVKPTVSNPYVCWAFPIYQDPRADHIGKEWKSGTIDIDDPNDIYLYRGRKRGFLLQNINQPSSNFPTIAGDSLQFTLTVAGILHNELSYSKQPANSNINLTINGVGEYDDITYYGRFPNEAIITLLGPKEGQSDTSFTPTTFIIYADKAKTKPIYSFTISQWIIKSNYNQPTFKESSAYCERIGYRLPTIPELTNMKNPKLDWNQGYPPSREEYVAQAQLKGGFYPEWGSRELWRLPWGSNTEVWVSNHHKNDNYYLVDSYGRISSKPMTAKAGRTFCISP
ncbi:hypothetical protein [Gilliamella sp. ESL0250]|uniref:hypothetical protein n=1 Tax=Gilliamella sp. ESL0250 TaxID=2705036 RepID=UPI00157FCDA7|nr:hypothetical protein [Gilliamella sp. ESL0250]NUF50310.1 hypothetical protein [Gilliamella sp. ESL0250]